MSIIHFESGTQTSAAAKAFCSVCGDIFKFQRTNGSRLRYMTINEI